MRISKIIVLPLLLAPVLPFATSAQAQFSDECSCYASVNRQMKINGGSGGMLCPRPDALTRVSMPVGSTQRVFRYAGDTIVADCVPVSYREQPPLTYRETGTGDDTPNNDRQPTFEPR